MIVQTLRKHSKPHIKRDIVEGKGKNAITHSVGDFLWVAKLS